MKVGDAMYYVVNCELYHHGIKGMKWGVRRYQNADGSLTSEGRQRQMYRDRTIRAGKTKKNVEEIISTMSSDDKDKLAIGDDGYLSYEQGSAVAKRVLLKDGDTPVAFFDILDDKTQYNVTMGTINEEHYRGKGYATKAAKRGMSYYEKNKDRLGNKPVIWGVRTDNEPSIKIAKSLGFELDKSSYSDDGQWVNYVKKYLKMNK